MKRIVGTHVQGLISGALRDEFGDLHVHCYEFKIEMYKWGTTTLGVALQEPDYLRTGELLDRLRTAWVQHLITGERIEA